MSKALPRKRRVSYIPTIVSITLVLFLLGMFGLLVFYANQLQTYLKENVQVSVLFMEDAHEPDILKLKTSLEREPHVNDVEFISKEEAKAQMKEDLGDNALEILGYNPFPPSLDVYFEAEYAHADSIMAFKQEMEEQQDVKEVYYQETLIKNIDQNVRIAGAVILVLAVIFLLIAIALINSTIRLSLYSKRFLIKTMQLIGATWWFIRKPFILRAVLHGFLGAIFAALLLAGSLYIVKRQFPFITLFQTYEFYAILLGIMMVLGILIAGITSFFSVNKYLRMRLEDLY